MNMCSQLGLVITVQSRLAMGLLTLGISFDFIRNTLFITLVPWGSSFAPHTWNVPLSKPFLISTFSADFHFSVSGLFRPSAWCNWARLTSAPPLSPAHHITSLLSPHPRKQQNPAITLQIFACLHHISFAPFSSLAHSIGNRIIHHDIHSPTSRCRFYTWLLAHIP